MRVLQLQKFHWLRKTLIRIILNSSKIPCLALEDVKALLLLSIIHHNILLHLKILLLLQSLLKILLLLQSLLLLLSIILLLLKIL
jgi:hypothetical protein